jgi:hypothetical protein
MMRLRPRDYTCNAEAWCSAIVVEQQQGMPVVFCIFVTVGAVACMVWIEIFLLGFVLA